MIAMNRILISAILISALLFQGTTFGQDVESSKGPGDPTATILGSETNVCLGDSVEAYLFFTGDGPWNAIINNNSGVYLTLKEVGTPYTIWLKPEFDDRYYIARVEDRRRRRGKTNGEVEVYVFQPTPVSIQLERTAYFQSEPGVNLVAVPEGGMFSGNGVAGNIFYPFIATPDGSPHTITYTYTNQHGCHSTDEADIQVLYGEGEVYLLSDDEPVSSICDDGETYVILGSNLDGIPGLFELREAGSPDPVSGHIADKDPEDDMATLDPTGLAGLYDIIYSYEFDGLRAEVTYRFQVNDLGITGIADLPDTVCKSSNPYPLVPEMLENDPGAIYFFIGPGVSGNQTDGYYFNPADPDVPIGEIEILLEYTSSGGCSSSITIKVTNLAVPDVDFTLTPVCLPEEGGVVTFKNLTTGKHMVDAWSWDFGDPLSGENNYSSKENPGHYYEEAGRYQISLTATTFGGCKVLYPLDTVLTDQPDADFTWLSDCFIDGEKVRFVDKSLSSFSTMDTLIWTFMTEDESVLSITGKNSTTDTVEFLFTSLDTYRVNYLVRNHVGCEGDSTKEIILKPISLLTDSGYEDDFNGEKSDWFTGSDGPNLSWIREEPDFAGFRQEAGDLAWFTALPSNNPGYLENSWVESQCFDFSTRNYPFLTMDLMKSFTPGIDGAVLQYQDLVSDGWKTLGNPGEGTGWYNVTEIFNRPGGSNYGWGLNLFNPNTEWVNASHHLDVVTGHPHVKFRIAIATEGAHEIDSGRYNHGFAFDNIFIGERVKISLLEYFTNSSTMESKVADDVVDILAMNHSGNLLDLQFHMDYPGVDPMNVNNPYPPSTRSFKYGIQGVPSAVLNGGTSSDHRFDFSDPFNEPNEEILQQASLEIPLFDVDLEVDWMEDRLEANVIVTCKSDTFNSNLQLYVAVIETAVSAYTGLNQDTLFRNVVLDILPTPAGKLLGNVWFSGRTDTRTYSWNYKNWVEDIEDLGVVAFVQDRDNGQVLQAASETLTPQVGLLQLPKEPPRLTIYPNPAVDRFYVNLGSHDIGYGVIHIMDLSGKLVSTVGVRPGFSLYQLDISTIPRGMYMVYWLEEREVKGRNKLVITQ